MRARNYPDLYAFNILPDPSGIVLEIRQVLAGQRFSLGLVEPERVHERAPDPDLIVAVRPGGVAGAADLGDDLSLPDLLPGPDQQLGAMAVVSFITVTVPEPDQFAVK